MKTAARLFLGSLLSASLAMPTDAAEITAQQRKACQADYLRHCASVLPGDGRVVACFIAKYDVLSARCAASIRDAACDPQTASMVTLKVDCGDGKQQSQPLPK